MSRDTPPRPMPRPMLLPGLRCLWRGRHRLQFGVDPSRAVVVELPDPAAARLLGLLDGSRSERAVLATAARQGIREPDARALLQSLRLAGLVVPATTLLPAQLPGPARRRLAIEASALAMRDAPASPGTPARLVRQRRTARVMITGYGTIAGPLAVALAQAGVGHVAPRIEPPPDRAPGTGGDEIAEAIARSAPGTRTTPLRRGEASFLVQVGLTSPANLAAAGFARCRLAHLPVAVRDGTVVIGPLVPPTGGPCLNCVDLHRRDRDPEWPGLAAQLARPGNDPCPAATTVAAAGLAAGEVLSWLDGEAPATLGASVEVIAPGRMRRRSWPPHPDCGCTPTRPRSGPG